MKLVLLLVLAEHPHYGRHVRDNGETLFIKVMSELVVNASYYGKAFHRVEVTFNFGFREFSTCVRDHMFHTRGVPLYKNDSQSYSTFFRVYLRF